MKTLTHTLAFALLGLPIAALGQQPQDNWYLENTLTKDSSVAIGGLNSPYGVAIGLDGRMYVADDGSDRIQVYLPDGTFSFGITNTFGSGQSFVAPRAMVCDSAGNLYVADASSTRNCIFVFDANGAYLRTIGGITGTGNGQLSGVHDVGVDLAGNVYVLESSANHARVSVFSPTGEYLRNWGGGGTASTASGLLQSPRSLAVGPDGRIFICQSPDVIGGYFGPPVWSVSIKIFSSEGLVLTSWPFERIRRNPGNYPYAMGPMSLRVDASGLVHVISCIYGTPTTGALDDPTMLYEVLSSAGVVLHTHKINYFNDAYSNFQTWPCHAVGPDGSYVFCHRNAKRLGMYRRAFRDQWAPPRNSIPLPNVLATVQRPGSSLLDIDYRVTDADDASVQTAMLAFKNGQASITNCIRAMTFVEGTGALLGPGIPANQTHRLTWDAGADWGVSLGDYRVAILVKDSRPNLLDIHYLHLPAGNGMPALVISRSPLLQSDFMQVWWWLLATGDAGITINGANIVGVGGAQAGQVLCTDATTSAEGRAYLYAKMNLREATPAEVGWARQGALPGGLNQFPAVSVAGRPKNVNEYGFDSGPWGTQACWVIPLN